MEERKKNIKRSDPPEEERRDYLKTVGALVAGLAIGGAAGWLSKPAERVELPGVTVTAPGATVTKTVTETPPITPTPTKPIPTEPIKIGHLDSLTGPAAIWGEPQVRGSQLVVDEINAAGGILGRKIELIVRDDEGKAATAVEMVRKFVEEDKVDFMTGITSSGCAMALAPVVEELGEKYGVPMIAIDGCTWGLHKERVWKYYFRWADPDAMESLAGAFLTIKHWPETKKIAGINPDYAYGRTSWAAYSAVMKALKPEVEIVYEGWPPVYSPDFTAHITSCIAAAPDVVWSSLWGGDVITFTKQAVGYGFFKTTQFVNVCGADSYLQMKKEEVPEGLFVNPHNYYWTFPDWDKWPLNKEFNEKYWDRYGVPPGQGSAGAYFTINSMKAAIEKAYAIKGEWPEREDIITSLRGLGLDYPGGRKYFRPQDGNAFGASKLFGFTTHDPRYPFPIITNIDAVPCELVAPPPGPIDIIEWIEKWAKPPT